LVLAVVPVEKRRAAAEVGSDDTKMTASYNVKHTSHVTVTGAVLQRRGRFQEAGDGITGEGEGSETCRAR
jgi:hypothetical protein